MSSGAEMGRYLSSYPDSLLLSSTYSTSPFAQLRLVQATFSLLFHISPYLFSALRRPCHLSDTHTVILVTLL